MKKLFLIFTFFLSLSNAAFAADKVNVYYFYGKPRCTTCVKIESYTKSAVASMKDKDVIYKVIDMDNPANKQMVKKYDLYTKSVILSKTKKGKEQWKSVDKIWLKVRNEQDYKNYIKSEIRQFQESK